MHHDADEHPEHAAAGQAAHGKKVPPPPAPGDGATNMHTEGQQDPQPLNMHTESAPPQND